MEKKGFIRAAGLVSAATILVRFAGLGREAATAYFFGTTLAYDAFLIAFMVPNFFRGILAEGGLNSAFIPVFAEYGDPGRAAEARRLVRETAGAALLLTLALALLALLVSSLALLLPLGEKALLVFGYLRLTVFYLVFISLAALSMGVLNSRGHFAAPAFSPLGLDFFWLAGLLAAGPLLGPEPADRAWGLAVGAVVGGAAQAAFSLPALRRRGFSIRPSFNFASPELRRMGRLLLPVILGVAVGPINLLTDYLLASLLAPGTVSSLWYANRLMQLPLGVFGIALGTVALPALSRWAAAGNHARLKSTLGFSLKLTFLLVIPSAVGMIFFRREIIALLFERGLFDALSTRETAYALLFYLPGVPAWAGASVLTRTFYALGDTRTPVRVGLMSIAFNLALNLALMIPMRQGGIALSTSLVGLVNFCFLFFFLRRRLGPLGGRSTAGESALFILYSLVAFSAARLAYPWLAGWAGRLPALVTALGTAALCVALPGHRRHFRRWRT